MRTHRGAILVETVACVFLMVTVALVAAQAIVVGVSLQRLGGIAGAAGRGASLGRDPSAEATAASPTWLRGRVTVIEGGSTSMRPLVVRVSPPSVVPFWHPVLEESVAVAGGRP